MKQIKDYLHLYYGCDVKSIEMGLIHPWITLTPETHKLFDAGRYKLILRPLSDITEEERIHILGERHKDEWNWTDIGTIDQKYAIIGQPEEWLYLLKQGFDLFGLIDAGLAIDRTTLK